MSPKCKVSFFFLFKLFTKSSWKSERQLPLQGLKSIKTTTEQLKQSEREKEKETTSNVWHLVLSTGSPRAPLGTESKIHWQTRLLNTQKGSLGAPAHRGGSVQSDCGVHSSLSGWGAGLFSSNHPSRKLSSLPCTGPLRGCPPPRERGLQQKTEQPGGLRADILMGSLSPPTPAWRMLNSASTYPPPSPPLHLSTPPLFQGQSFPPALPTTSSLELGGI